MKIETLKAFLEDEEIRQKYAITDHDIKNISFAPIHSKHFIALLQHAISIIEKDDLTVNTAAANINTFLENRLRQ